MIKMTNRPLLVLCLMVCLALFDDVQSQRPTRPSRFPSLPSRPDTDGGECEESDESRIPCRTCVCDPEDSDECTWETNLMDCIDGAVPDRPTDLDICQVNGEVSGCARCICDMDSECDWELDPSLPGCNVAGPGFPSEFPMRRPSGGFGTCDPDEDVKESVIPCLECMCNSTGQLNCMLDFESDNCDIPDGPDFTECEAGDMARPFPRCQSCMCDEMGTCSWVLNTTLNSCDVFDCGEDAPQCFVNPCRFTVCPSYPEAICVPNYCTGCNATFYDGNDMVVNCYENLNCSSEEAAECTRDPCSFAICPGPPNRGIGGNTPSRTKNAKCVPDYCECEAKFIDEDGEEIRCFAEDDDDDDEDDDSCRPGQPKPLLCRNCKCLNDDCGLCTGKDRCEWYEDPMDCGEGRSRGEEGSPPGQQTCPGNRPVSPCGDVDPCEILGDCPGNPDLECRKFECSQCKALYYNEEGIQIDCPANDKRKCNVPGRGRQLNAGDTFDDPEDPCQLCTCGPSGGVDCTEDRKCGKQRRFKVGFEVDNCIMILNDTNLLEDFIDEFKKAIAKGVNISASNIKDIVPSCGSLIFEASLLETDGTPNGESIDVDAVRNMIETGIKDGAIMISLDNESFEPIADSFTDTGGSASSLGYNVIVLSVLTVVAALWA